MPLITFVSSFPFLFGGFSYITGLCVPKAYDSTLLIKSLQTRFRISSPRENCIPFHPLASFPSFISVCWCDCVRFCIHFRAPPYATMQSRYLSCARFLLDRYSSFYFCLLTFLLFFLLSLSLLFVFSFFLSFCFSFQFFVFSVCMWCIYTRHIFFIQTSKKNPMMFWCGCRSLTPATTSLHLNVCVYVSTLFWPCPRIHECDGRPPTIVRTEPPQPPPTNTNSNRMKKIWWW